MSRVAPLNGSDLSIEMQEIMAAGEEVMGFTPNDALVMAHQPDLLKAMLAMVQAVYKAGSVSLELKRLVAVMTSSAAGCQYCQAHTQFGAMKQGISAEKLKAIWDYQSSELFTKAERAALDVARAAAFTPNATSDQDIANLKQHFSDQQIVEIVGVIAMFGFLNRWNSTLATDLEQIPKEAVQQHGLMKF